MEDRIERALAITPESSASARTIDITTTGARTGRPRRIEIWFYRVDGEVHLTTRPAVRSWYANLRANPEFTVHLKHGVRADLAAWAEPVEDPVERRRIFWSVIEDLNHPRHRGYLAQPVEPLERWVEGSPLVRVHFAVDVDGTRGASR